MATDKVFYGIMRTMISKAARLRLSRLPILEAQVAELLNCTTEDVALLVTAGKLRSLGMPNPLAVKFFSAVELIALLADRDGLDDATKTISNSGSERTPGVMVYL